MVGARWDDAGMSRVPPVWFGYATHRLMSQYLLDALPEEHVRLAERLQVAIQCTAAVFDVVVAKVCHDASFEFLGRSSGNQGLLNGISVVDARRRMACMRSSIRATLTETLNPKPAREEQYAVLVLVLVWTIGLSNNKGRSAVQWAKAMRPGGEM